MSENKSSDLEGKFADWLAEKTSSETSTADTPKNKSIDQNVGSNVWQQRMNTASHLAHYVEVNGQESVPSWDRGQAFGQEKNTWWQWRGLPALSLAFSSFAIALVLFRVEFVIHEQSIMLSFAGNNQVIQDKKIASLVEQKLQAFASEQQVVLANYAADIKVKQQDNNLQLASYIMGASRQERKEDITEFINYVNEQRKDAQFEQTMKFNQIEQVLRYQNNQLDDSALPLKNANWIQED